jgi:hypothetical protein
MAFWRSRGWFLCLVFGYLLFLGILVAENVFTLNLMRGAGNPGLAAEAFRAGWLEWCRAFPPARWFIEGPCQRTYYLSLAIFVPAALALGAGYLGALRAVQRAPELWTLPRLLGCAALAAVPLLFMVQVTSGDYVAYLLAGRIVSVYHLSPWHHPLAEFPAEFIYLAPSAWGPQLKCAYGPVWVAVMAVTTGISHLLSPGAMTLSGLMLNLLLLRLANAAALAAAALAIWKIQGMLWPRQQRLVTAAFLLNPLVVWESLGALHNDIWGVALLLWGCYLFLRDDLRFVVPLALSILTKYVAFAVTPFLAVYYWRRREWAKLAWVAGTVLLSLGLTALTDPQYMTSRLAAHPSEFSVSPTSLPLTLVSALGLTRELPIPELIANVFLIAKVMAVLCLPFLLALAWRTRTREEVISHSMLALTLYLTAAYMQTMQWYYLWPLGLLCAMRWTAPLANAAAASWAVMLGYVMYFWMHNGWSPASQVVGFLLCIALPATVCLAGRGGRLALCPLPVAPAEDDQSGRRGGGSRRGQERTAALR